VRGPVPTPSSSDGSATGSARALFLFLLLFAGSCAPGHAGEPAPAPVAYPQFVHPGLLSSKAELDFVKAKIKSGEEPWSSRFQGMKNSRFGDVAWSPSPVSVVNARSQNAGREIDDATAAYTQALLWYFTNDETYARKSAEILDAWSARLTGHTSPDLQEQLVAAWGGSLFPLAGEILRASYPKWTHAEITRFSAMLDQAFLPLLVSGNPRYNGNWELAMINALMGIGVFNNDASAFDRGVLLWRKRVPAYFYLTSDGPRPVRPPGTTALDSTSAIDTYWFHPTRYFDGLCQETRRDYGHHVQEGFASAINSAEIAWHQGIDLYAGQERRLIAAMEFHARAISGNPVPKEYFPDGFVPAAGLPTWEIAYNHFHNRKGFNLPATDALIRTKIRPSPFAATHNNMVWESLTHAELDADVIQVDVRALLTGRAVTTLTDGRLVPWTKGVDGAGLADGYLTVEAAIANGDTKALALPGNGCFPATPAHPLVILNFSDADGGGFQTRGVEGAGGFSFSVSRGRYQQLQVFMTSAEGPSQLRFNLIYADGTAETREIPLPDYYNDAPAGAHPVFSLIANLPKWNATGRMTERGHHNIHGVNLSPDERKELVSVQVGKTAAGYLVFWGATGVKAN
jgi:hypothetical protein